MGRKKRPIEEKLKVMCYMRNVAASLNAKQTGYDIEKKVAPWDPKTTKLICNVRNKKFDRHINGTSTPNSKSIEQYKALAKGCSYILELPLWKCFSTQALPENSWWAMSHNLPPKLHQLVLKGPAYLNGEKLYRTQVTQRTLEAVVRHGGLESLTCLLSLIRHITSEDTLPRFSYFELVQKTFRSLVSCCTNTALGTISQEIFEYIGENIINYDLMRKADCPFFTNSPNDFQILIGNTSAALNLIQPCFLLFKDEEEKELLYWLSKANIPEINREMLALKHGNKINPNTDLGLVWLIERLNYILPQGYKLDLRRYFASPRAT